MEAELNPKLRPYRLVSGEPAVVESILNELGDSYAVTAWNFATCDGRVIVTAICISASILRQAQIAAAQMPASGRR
jgi:hypothetical protein